MSFRNVTLLLYLSVSVAVVFADQIVLEQGILEGTTNTSRNGTVFRAYYGVPYAKPPLGQLRFKPPEKAEPWQGVFNATVYPSSDASCIQVVRESDSIQGTEDCLHLNVFAPLNSKPGDNVPVIVFFFGGMFMTGSNIREGPHYFMNHRIILVKPNFRLGLLGHLSTGDDVISGNMAYKDQTMAIKWTKENIRAFGGDPEMITIYGHSTGAISSMFHAFSPLSKGLFKRVIMQSGSAYHPEAENTPAKARQIIESFAEILNCEPRNTAVEIRDCLMRRNASEIVLNTKKLAFWKHYKNGMFGVVAEDPKAKDVFMTDAPIKNSFQSTQPEWLIGMTMAEAAQFVPSYFDDDGEEAKFINNRYNLLVPYISGYYHHTKPNSMTFMTRLMRTHYFHGEEISPDTDVQLVAFVTDSQHAFPITESIKRYKGKRYVYKYNYRSNFSTQLNELDYKKYLGVAHVDDLQLMMQREDSMNYLSQQDVEFGDELITRYINFVYSGDPNTPFPINRALLGNWQPVSTDRIEYLYIGQSGSAMQTDYNKESYRFWRSIPAYSNFF